VLFNNLISLLWVIKWVNIEVKYTLKIFIPALLRHFKLSQYHLSIPCKEYLIPSLLAYFFSIVINNIILIKAIRNKNNKKTQKYKRTHIILLLHLRCLKRIELNNIRKKRHYKCVQQKILLCLYITIANICENNHLLENWCINFINCWSISTNCYLKASFCCKKAITSKDGISISTQTDKSKINIGTLNEKCCMFGLRSRQKSHTFFLLFSHSSHLSILIFNANCDDSNRFFF